MEGFNSLIENASAKDLWLMHGAIIEKLKNINLDTSSATSICDTDSTTSSNRNKTRKLSDFIPYFASGILSSPEPCYIKTLDNLVKADLVLENGKCFFKTDNLIFKSPSAFAQHHSNQITPLHPKATKPGSGWSHIMVEKNNKLLKDILEPVKAVKKAKGMTEEQKTRSSERSKKWAAEAHEILAVMRATNPDATYNDAQKELKKRKTLQSDSEEEKPEKPETKFIDSIIYKYISRLSENELKNAPFLLTMKFGMTVEEAEKYL